jgi:hypothetical protein
MHSIRRSYTFKKKTFVELDKLLNHITCKLLFTVCWSSFCENLFEETITAENGDIFDV